MDGAFVKIQDDELKALCSRLNEMALSPDERKSLLASIGEEIMTQTKDRLAEKKTPDGDDWADIADSTKAYYRKKFGTENPGNGILWRQGGLMDSLTHEENSWKVIAGATKVYAAVHQLGWRQRSIAARPYLGLGDDDKTEIATMINLRLEEKTGAKS